MGRRAGEGAWAGKLPAMVKGIAHKLSEKNPAGGNYYRSVWSELYRRYSVTTYRRAPAVEGRGRAAREDGG